MNSHAEREPDTRVIARPSRGRRHSPLSALVRAHGLTSRSSPSGYAQNRPGRFRDAEAPGSNPGIPTILLMVSRLGRSHPLAAANRVAARLWRATWSPSGHRPEEKPDESVTKIQFGDEIRLTVAQFDRSPRPPSSS